jgi:hypothetical protein
MAKKVYLQYRLEKPARALYINAVEASKPKNEPNAKSKYSVLLGLDEVDAKELFALAKKAIEDGGFGPFNNSADYQLCIMSGKKAAEKALLQAQIEARGKSEEDAAKIKENAERRAELVKDYAGILSASSRVAFHDRFLDRYTTELDGKERERADTMGFGLSVLSNNGKVIALDNAHLFAEYKDKFYRGCYVGGLFTLTPWARKTADAKDGVSAYIHKTGLIFVKDGERLASTPSVQDSFAHYKGEATEYSPTEAASISADDF